MCDAGFGSASGFARPALLMLVRGACEKTFIDEFKIAAQFHGHYGTVVRWNVRLFNITSNYITVRLASAATSHTSYESGWEFRQVVNIVYWFEFCIVEPKRKQALLRSNLPGIGSPDRMSLFEKDVVKSTSFFISRYSGGLMPKKTLCCIGGRSLIT